MPYSVNGHRGYLPGTTPGVCTKILPSGLQMFLENNNSFLNPRKEKSIRQGLTFWFWPFPLDGFSYEDFIRKQIAHAF